jgi:PAS domain S-box-containing protein
MPAGRARTIFTSAITLLCLCAVATYLSFFYFSTGERWVTHTQEVRSAVGDLESIISHAARARMSYLVTGNDSDLAEYQAAISQLTDRMHRLQALTSDNPVQVRNCGQLESIIKTRIRAWEDSVAQKQQGKPVDPSGMMQLNLSLNRQSDAAITQIRQEEDRLLADRRQAAHRRFLLASGMVVASFAFALLLLSLSYRLLNRELRAREEAERAAREAYQREAALRPQEERFRLFIDTVKDYAIYTLDAKGHVSSWNQGAERLKGYTASEILGKHFSRFYAPDDVRSSLPDRELETAAREGRVEEEGWRIRKDGSRFWANAVLTAIRDQAGQLIGFAQITRDFTERMRVHAALERSNVELAAEVNERKSAEQRLAASEQWLRELSLRLLSTQDEERRRIGRELHDSLGQYLALLKLKLDGLSAVPTISGGMANSVSECVRLADDAIKEVRTISYLLYPPMLEELGLKSAIPWYLEGFSKRSSIQTRFDADPQFDRLPREKELALFRVLQESLTNVHRHSGSPNANVCLTLSNGNAILEIRDTGKGIPSTLLEQSGEDWMGSLGVGLRGMDERMRQLGGKLEVSSTDNGTVVRAVVPAGEPVAAFSESA